MSRRLASLDMMKGLAMIMVILVHFNQSFSNGVDFFRFGQMGCQLFLVVSGFGACLSFEKKCKKETSFVNASKSFFLSRIKTIAPPWWFMMFIIYIVNTILIQRGHALVFGTNRSFRGILFNALFLNGLIPQCNNNVMPGGWYIGTSMLLYSITPILICGYKRINKKFFWIITSICSFVVLCGLAVLASKTDQNEVLTLVGNNSFGYYSILSQYPCYSLGILLYFDYIESGSSYNTYNIFKDFVIGCLIMILSIVVFFHPYFMISYILCVLFVGLATYYILRAMILFERQYNITRKRNFIMECGKNSLYVFLIHPFFVWTFVDAVQYILCRFDIASDTYFIYCILLPIVIILSYCGGLVLEYIIDHIVSWTTARFCISSTVK